MNDPLESLLVDGKAIDRERLAGCINGLLGVNRDGGNIVLKSEFMTLKTKQKIVAYLLGRKAATLLGKLDEQDTESAGPTEISEALGIPMGTVGRVVRELAESRVVKQGDDKRYSIASYQLSAAERILKEGREGGD